MYGSSTELIIKVISSRAGKIRNGKRSIRLVAMSFSTEVAIVSPVTRTKHSLQIPLIRKTIIIYLNCVEKLKKDKGRIDNGSRFCIFNIYNSDNSNCL